MIHTDWAKEVSLTNHYVKRRTSQNTTNITTIIFFVSVCLPELPYPYAKFVSELDR